MDDRRRDRGDLIAEIEQGRRPSARGRVDAMDGEDEQRRRLEVLER